MSVPAPALETSDRMKRVRARDTKAEMAVRRILFSRGLRYFVDRRPSQELRTRADIVFPRPRLAVFIDGCFWHRCNDHGTVPKTNSDWWLEKLNTNVRRDRDADASLTEAGWTVQRFWEHEDPTLVADRIESSLRTASGHLL